MTTALEKHSAKLAQLCPGTIAHSNMSKFMAGTAGGHSRGLKMMIDGLEVYCNAHAAEWDKVGNDGYLCQYVEEIAHGLIGLLSGNGRFDGGTLWAAIAEICEKNGFSYE